MIAAHDHEGAAGADGLVDIADIPADGFWRDSHDRAGAHEPFTVSVETHAGAPRAQAHFFRDPESPEASSALGRVDVQDLVDPYALEVDHDYDCFHDSNPLCEYTLYGPLCAPQPASIGVDIFELGYGDADLSWRPGTCGD